VAALLTQAGLKTEAVSAIVPELWAKAILNAGINSITAITGLPNGQLLAQPGLKELLERTVREGQAVAEATGIALPSEDLVERARLVASMTAENKSSMLQDIERGRPTEVDSINGAIVQQARALGLEAPVNAALWALVKGIESTTRVG
jgi:2-dehydropantoate 2-reductase